MLEHPDFIYITYRVQIFTFRVECKHSDVIYRAYIRSGVTFRYCKKI
jgi:hypothetical protein